MAAADPFAGRRVSATIKLPESARYASDNPWMVFEGTVDSVREQIIDAFSMVETEGMNLFEVVVEAQSQASAVGNAAAKLGGKVVSSGNRPQAAPAAEQAPEKSEAEVETERLSAEIEAAASVDALKQLWARNQEAFKDADLMAAWRAKGKSLQSA